MPESPEPIKSESAPPVVTVAILTFNHAPFIEQAVHSVLAQNTNFPIEILLADDCSTDETPEILDRLETKYPDRLTQLQRKRNLGLSANLQECRERAMGRYLAILEGDDYWTDPLKLQKQHDALEDHPDWSMCYTAARVFAEDASHKDFVKPSPFPEKALGVGDFVEENQIQTMSVAMYRQGVVTRTPDWHAQLRIGDWALHVLHANKGPIGFVPEVTTAYRVHPGGLWSGLSTFRRWEEMIRLFRFLEQHFEGEYAASMKAAQDKLAKDFDDRVAYLERIEYRYNFLRLNRVAAVFRFLKSLFTR